MVALSSFFTELGILPTEKDKKESHYWLIIVDVLYEKPQQKSLEVVWENKLVLQMAWKGPVYPHPSPCKYIIHDYTTMIMIDNLENDNLHSTKVYRLYPWNHLKEITQNCAN